MGFDVNYKNFDLKEIKKRERYGEYICKQDIRVGTNKNHFDGQFKADLNST